MEKKYDVFISCKSEDYPQAEKVSGFLRKNGITPFLASESLRRVGNTAYLDEIDKALNECEHLIVFCSKPEYAESKFVKEEWQSFRNEMLSGRKNGNILSIVQNNISVGELPYGLRRYEVISFSNYEKVLLNYLTIKSQDTILKRYNESRTHINNINTKGNPKIRIGSLEPKKQDKSLAPRTKFLSKRQGIFFISILLCFIGLSIYFTTKLADSNPDINDSPVIAISDSIISKENITTNKAEQVAENIDVSEEIIPQDFVLVEGGNLKYKGHDYEDYKIHDVSLDSFYVSKYELTQKEFQSIMEDLKEFNYSWLREESWYENKGPNYNKIKGEKIPVRGTYIDFINYCEKRSLKEGYDGFYKISGSEVHVNPEGNGYRLLTPYEWVFAAFGGNLNKHEKYLGGKNLDEVAWHYGNSGMVPHPVGEKKPNSIGIHDIQGNAPELLQGQGKYYYFTSMVGGYNVSNWNYEQTYDPTYIWGNKSMADLSTWTYGTRIAFIPKNLKNRNTEIVYKY